MLISISKVASTIERVFIKLHNFYSRCSGPTTGDIRYEHSRSCDVLGRKFNVAVSLFFTVVVIDNFLQGMIKWI